MVVRMKARAAVCVAAALTLAMMTAGTAGAAGSTAECVGYQDGGYAPGTTHLMVSNTGAGSLGFEVRSLDLDRTVLRSEHFDLAGGASRDLDTASRDAGYAAQVLSAGELSVESYVISAGADGADERREIGCVIAGA